MGLTVITGTNRGIGLELTKQLMARGDTVVAVCRRPSPELVATGATIIADVDVADAASVAALPGRLPEGQVDLLINNAGILTREGLDDLSFERVQRQLEVNSLGPLRMTSALLPRMTSGSKVAIITSRMGSIGDNTSGGMYGYRMSKAAVNAAGRSLAHDLAPRGIAVAILHPGFVRTQMTGNSGDVEPAHAAADLIARIDALDAQSSGQFLHAKGEALPW